MAATDSMSPDAIADQGGAVVRARRQDQAQEQPVLRGGSVMHPPCFTILGFQQSALPVHAFAQVVGHSGRVFE